MRTSISRTFRHFILTKYPALVGNEPFLRFFRYLCFGTFTDKDTGQLVIPTKMLAEDFYQESDSSHFKGKEVLEQFRDRVLPDLTWTEHSHTLSSWSGKARQLSNTGFDPEMREALRQESLSPSEDQVDFITGETYRRDDRYLQRDRDKQAYEEALARLQLNDTQAKIVTYLHGINAGHTFLRKLASNRDEIAAAIHKLPEAAQAIPYRTLASVQQNPNVYYLPSSQERTCRLSARGDTILGLKKDIRRAATKGWVECDLRSSQFAILAATLQAPLSQAFIASGESLWRSLYRFLSGMDTEPPGEIKAVLKETIYSLCFGKGKKKLAKMLAARDMEHLLEHPVLVELLALRERWFEEIRAAKGASDVWGTWHALDETRDPRTKKSKRWAGAIAATVIQSIEMEIIAPIFEVAQKHGEADRFQIVLFQHDGATISFTAKGKREKRAMAKLKRAVEARAKELGVSTVLEFAQL